MQVLGTKVNITSNEDEEIASRIQKGWFAYTEMRHYMQAKRLQVRHKMRVLENMSFRY